MRFALLFLVGCKTRQLADPSPQIVTNLVEASPEPPEASAAPLDSGPPVVEFVLSRGMCFGVCPEYTVTIENDGTIAYEGRKFVAKHGRVKDAISAADVQALAKKFDAANFFQLDVPKNCDRMVTDSPTFVISERKNGLLHEVTHYSGNMCAPDALDTLEEAIDEAAKTSRWVRCGKQPNDFCDRP